MKINSNSITTHIKDNAKILGISGGKVSFSENTAVPISLVLCRNTLLEAHHNYLSPIDDGNFTTTLLQRINNQTWKHEIRLVFCEGIFTAGLSLIDLDMIHDVLRVPVISITFFRRLLSNRAYFIVVLIPLWPSAAPISS